ncbi:MAG: glycosyltransferase family 2 protein [Muribaculaceae bacterium]|nr:glycosyltransferase family 2 protein [Muribaculaceae bacterium]
MAYNYTIIIPHYNGPTLLERLLKSIPNRKDIQTIVVDDCSSSDTINKLEVLKKQFTSVEFYSTRVNGGGGKARNIGISHAEGRYVIFADADDFFTPEFDNILSTYQDSKEYDIIFFNNTSVDSDTLQPSNRNNQLSYFFDLARKDSGKAMLAFRFIFGEPWCKIVRRSIIEDNNIKFDETPIHNDTRYSYLVGYYGKKIKLDSRPGYCITSRSNSVSKQISDEKLLLRTNIFCKKMNFLKKNDIPLIDPLVFTSFTHAIRKGDLSLLRKNFEILKYFKYSKLSFLKDYLTYKRNGYFTS